MMKILSDKRSRFYKILTTDILCGFVMLTTISNLAAYQKRKWLFNYNVFDTWPLAQEEKGILKKPLLCGQQFGHITVGGREKEIKFENALIVVAWRVLNKINLCSIKKEAKREVEIWAIYLRSRLEIPVILGLLWCCVTHLSWLVGDNTSVPAIKMCIEHVFAFYNKEKCLYDDECESCGLQNVLLLNILKMSVTFQSFCALGFRNTNSGNTLSTLHQPLKCSRNLLLHLLLRSTAIFSMTIKLSLLRLPKDWKHF